jgi:hypothetical protein
MRSALAGNKKSPKSAEKVRVFRSRPTPLAPARAYKFV